MVCVMVMRALCWARCWGCRWTTGCGSGSWLRRAATPCGCWRRRGGWRLEGSFRGGVAGLPADARGLLRVAAAEPVGDPVLVWRAAGRLGIGLQAAAETDGLLAIGARVTFRHPLVRSTVYRAASPEERQAAHRALADATDPEVDPDRRAWHLAQATRGFDEDVAFE